MPSSRLACIFDGLPIAATSGSSASASTVRRAMNRATSGMLPLPARSSASAGFSATSGSTPSQIIFGRF